VSCCSVNPITLTLLILPGYSVIFTELLDDLYKAALSKIQRRVTYEKNYLEEYESLIKK